MSDRSGLEGKRQSGLERFARPLIAVLAITTLVGCKPLDDGMVAIFGRSMRDSRSFDPYEHPMPPAEGSVAFAAGNFPTADGVVNLGPVSYTHLPLPTIYSV